jgi:hypothetical protein
VAGIAVEGSVIFRQAVAVHAPAHRKRAVLVYALHLRDVSVAGLAGHSSLHVTGVVEVDEVGKHVNLGSVWPTARSTTEWQFMQTATEGTFAFGLLSTFEWQ